MEGVVVIIVLCVGFILYALPAGIPRLKQDDFFLMDRSAAVNQYNDTTVAYSLQVAVTVYFFYWGFEYGLSNVFFIASWFLGLLAFGLCAPRLASFLSKSAFDGSMFSVISRGQHWLRVAMGIIFIVSLVGLLFTELYLTAQFVDATTKARLVVPPSSHLYFWIGFGFLAFVVLWYCSLGGVRKVVATDTWQLSFAYIGAALFIATLCPFINRHAGTGAMRFVAVGMAALFLLMAASPSVISLLTRPRGERRRSNTSYVTFLALLTSAITCLVPIFILIPHTANPPLIFPKPIFSMLHAPYGWAPIAGFTIINLIWQFSDYTAYHRLALLDLPKDEESKVKKIRESIFVTMLNSPLTWGLGIFAGMAIDASGILPPTSSDVFDDFVSKAAMLANSGDQLMRWSLIGLALFLGSAMLSTVDSGFMSVALIMVRDILRKPLSAPARFMVNLSVIATMSAFAYLLVQFNINILVFLNATYAWGLIFGGICIAVLYGRRINLFWVCCSLIFGAIVGSWATFNPLKLPDLVILVFPSVAAITVSIIFVLIGLWRSGCAPLDENAGTQP